MLARLTDWKPTILGLAIALVIVAALFARPEWSAADLATLAGGVAAALLGAWARSGASEKPSAPTVPPLPLLAIATLALVGCARPLDAAVTAANIGRDVGLAAHDTIAAACVPAYKAAADKAAIAAVDARCVPAEKAYRTYAALHLAAVVAIQRAQVGAAPEAEALAAARAVAQAGAGLAAAVREVSK